MTWPRFDVVSTEYQEQTSATAISGTTTRDVVRPTSLPVAREISRSIKAHWATKHNSAIVATERPTTTLESQVSKMTMRCTSYTGKAERKAHPDT